VCSTQGNQDDARRIVGDDEVLYRRVPNATPWFEPPDRISTFNFKLNEKRGDIGLSVYRAAIVTGAEVLQRPDAMPGSQLTVATAGQIRWLTSTAGIPLQLDVVAVDDHDNPGHAEIRGPIPGKLDKAASKALRDLFKLVEHPI
jgi:hypothetical protein